MPLVHRDVAEQPLVIDRIVVADREGDGARRRRRARAGDHREQDEGETDHAGTARRCSRIATMTSARIAAARSVSAIGAGSLAPGASSPAATREGLCPAASIARSKVMFPAVVAIRSWLSQPLWGTQPIPASVRRSVMTDGEASRS